MSGTSNHPGLSCRLHTCSACLAAALSATAAGSCSGAPGMPGWGAIPVPLLPTPSYATAHLHALSATARESPDQESWFVPRFRC